MNWLQRMKSAREISSFQISAAYDLAKKLHAIMEVKFKFVLGEREFWIECNLSNEVKVFIYNDGAEISGKELDIRLEIYDFLNEDEMRHDFLKHVVIVSEKLAGK